MAYASWSVVFGEQPSAAKWNILGTNDASFNDGTGIADNVITNEKLSSTNQELRRGAPSGTIDTTSSTFIDAVVFSDLSVPTWATKAFVTFGIQYRVVSALTDGNFRLVIGSDIGSTIVGARNSQPTTGQPYVAGQDEITLTGTGTQAFKIQFNEIAGTGAIRVVADSNASAIVTYLP